VFPSQERFIGYTLKPTFKLMNMPPKRKAPPSNGTTVKRSKADTDASGDDYTEDTSSVDEDIQNAVDRFDPRRNAQRMRSNQKMDSVSRLFTCDQGAARLKPDHTARPLWVDPEGRIILESFSPMFQQAQNFLINIAEPQSRVSRMHEYSLTAHSLFAAVSVGLTTQDIIRQLDIFSKVPLDPSLVSFIRTSTESFGRVRLVLKDTKYFVESTDPAVLQKLLRDPIIAGCRADPGQGIQSTAAPAMGNLVIQGTNNAAGVSQAVQSTQEDIMATLREDDEEEEEIDQVHSFQIEGKDRQTVAKRGREIGLPLTEEYDFREDHVNANLDINLKPAAQIRPYQEQALSKMFGNGRARSGIIVLPCGAGKTLVGITAGCTVKKGIIVLCNSAMSVVQWRTEFIKWTNINPEDIAAFTSDNKEMFPRNTGVLITTYTMIGDPTRRSYDTKKVLEQITAREWGLMILDEVHVAPAHMFSKVTYLVAAHAKLGLTATLLREDDKIEELNFLIGPKLYEANWQELSEQGHIAKVQCAEVWCPMTIEFYRAYLEFKQASRQQLLYTMNPRKFQACQFLIKYHEDRGDKIIVFADNVYALEKYAKKLGKAFIYGGTPQAERLNILENFQHNPDVNTIFLSKIGDTSLDLPEATCLIQISSHFGSRRQEAQRLGRILRAKRRNDEGFNAFFYSLVSKDTNEMYYSSKRQAFLVDQGYAFKVITHLHGIESMPGLAFTTAVERRELLQEILLAIDQGVSSKQQGAEDEQLANEGDTYWSGAMNGNRKKKMVRRTAATLAEMSGGQDMAYQEFNSSKNKELKKNKKDKGLKGMSEFHKKMYRNIQKEREINIQRKKDAGLL
jgi:DNA excision repair protein ERCC-3